MTSGYPLIRELYFHFPFNQKSEKFKFIENSVHLAPPALMVSGLSVGALRPHNRRPWVQSPYCSLRFSTSQSRCQCFLFLDGCVGNFNFRQMSSCLSPSDFGLASTTFSRSCGSLLPLHLCLTLLSIQAESLAMYL